MDTESMPSKRERREMRRQERDTNKEKNAQAKTLKKFIAWGVAILVIGYGGWALWHAAPQGTGSGNNSLLQVRDADWVEGGAGAPVTLIEYGDLQCPACGAYYPLVKQLHKDFPDALRVVFRHFPLTQIHQNALAAARATEAAGRQGRFWEMHDLLYENQSSWSETKDAEATFKIYAGQLGLDTGRFSGDLRDAAIGANITFGEDSGNSLGIRGTPTFFLNNKQIANPQSYEEFRSLIEAAIQAASTPSPSLTPSDEPKK